MAAASKSDDKKAMDISKPRKAAPDPSSRPLLVTNRPMVEDPMVVKSEAKEATSETPKTELAHHGDKVIEPLTNLETDKETTEPKETEPVNKDTLSEPEAKPDDDKTVAADDAKPTTDDDQSGSDAAIVDAIADQATKKKDEPTEEEKKKQEEIQKLIDEKKYFVPIGQVAKRRSQRTNLVILVLLLLLVGAYLVVDSGVVKTSIKLPVHIFKQKT